MWQFLKYGPKAAYTSLPYFVEQLLGIAPGQHDMVAGLNPGQLSVTGLAVG